MRSSFILLTTASPLADSQLEDAHLLTVEASLNYFSHKSMALTNTGPEISQISHFSDTHFFFSFSGGMPILKTGFLRYYRQKFSSYTCFEASAETAAKPCLHASVCAPMLRMCESLKNFIDNGFDSRYPIDIDKNCCNITFLKVATTLVDLLFNELMLHLSHVK